MTAEHVAVGTGISTYVALLDAPNVALQLQAARLISQFPERAQELHIHLVQAYAQAKAVEVQANLLLALGELFAPQDGDRYALHPIRQRPSSENEEGKFFAHIKQTATHELLVFCASLALARVADENTFPEVASYLANVMGTQPLPEELGMFQKRPCARAYGEIITNAAASALKELGGGQR